MKLDVKPGDPVWYRFLTASRWANAIGVGPESRQYVYNDMVIGPQWRQQWGENPAIAWGRNNEASGLAWFRRFIGPVTVNQSLYVSSQPEEAPYILAATPDGIGDGYGVEVKCPYNSGHNGPLLHHIIQAYACAYVLEMSLWYLVYWYPHETYVYAVEANPRAFNVIKPYLLEFIGYVESRTPPPRFTKNERSDRMAITTSTFNALTKKVR